MATKSKMSIRDLFNPITNPAGGFGTAHTTPSALFAGRKPVVMPPPGPQSRIPNQSLVPTAPAAPVVAGGGARGGAAAPAAAAPSTAAPAAPSVPKQWLNADGTFKDPNQIASDIAGTLKGATTGPDVPRLSGNQFGGGAKTAEQLATEARRIAAVRNDIASGEKDPYGVGSTSGIAYTPAELKAIEGAYAGVYDPALDSAMSKLEARQTADGEAAKWEKELKKLAVQHGYDMEKMEKDQAFQYGLAAYKAALDAKNMTGLSEYITEQQTRSVGMAEDLLERAIANPAIFGASAAAPWPDWLRTDDFRNYSAELESLKNSVFTSELAAMRADSKTGGAVGQVAVQEGERLANALGALNMSQTPDNIQKNLRQVITSVNRYREAKGAPPIASSVSSSNSSLPPTMILNGQTLKLQADGTYE